jgi:hypothetical protein
MLAMHPGGGGTGMTEPRRLRPASVSATGWLCVAAGGLLLLSAGVLALAGFMRRAMAEQGLDPFAPIEGTLDPLSLLVFRHLESLAVIQCVLGAVTLIVGIGFLGIRPWARPALEILAWVTLAGSVISGVWGIGAWLMPGGGSPVASLGGLATPVAGMLLTLAQCVVCAWILRYLRSPETRALFRRKRDPSS